MVEMLFACKTVLGNPCEKGSRWRLWCGQSNYIEIGLKGMGCDVVDQIRLDVDAGQWQAM